MKINFFDFLGRKIDTAEISTVVAETANQIYFRELAFYIAKSYIANTLSKCEIKVYKDGNEVHDELYYALNVSPNPNQNGSQFVNKLIETYYDKGDALVIMPKQNKLYVADGFQIDVQPLSDNKFTGITVETKQINTTYKASNVLYFKLDNENVRGLVNNINRCYGEMIAAALASYKRGNGKKYKLLLESYKAGDKDFVEAFENVIKKQLDAFINNDNVVFPQFKGTNLEEIASGGNASSADVVALRKEIFDTTAAACKIPLSMMYGNITNMNEIVKVYLSFCIDPLADMIGEEITRKMFTFDEWKRGNYVKVDTSCINHVDILEVADAVSKSIGSGAVNVDEIRERLDKKALNTAFSTAYWMTKNYDRAENVLNGVD